MDRWLSRLSFSFFIFAMLLLWFIYKSKTGQAPPLSQARMAMYLVAAMLAIVMGMLGVRARHRAMHEERDSDDQSKIL
jgi:hypothetical protein